MNHTTKVHGVHAFRILVAYCPVCDRLRALLGCYRMGRGWSHTCMACGERWRTNGRRAGGPFMHVWRRRSLLRARRQLVLCVAARPIASRLCPTPSALPIAPSPLILQFSI